MTVSALAGRDVRCQGASRRLCCWRSAHCCMLDTLNYLLSTTSPTSLEILLRLGRIFLMVVGTSPAPVSRRTNHAADVVTQDRSLSDANRNSRGNDCGCIEAFVRRRHWCASSKFHAGSQRRMTTQRLSSPMTLGGDQKAERIA